MKSKKIEKAIRTLVKDEVSEKAREQSGVVVKTYYEPLNESDIENFNRLLADVKIVEDKINEERVLKEVPIIINSVAPNIDGAKIKKGDRVSISYYRGNRVYPRITGKLYKDPKERSKEMEKKWGVYIADAYGYF